MPVSRTSAVRFWTALDQSPRTTFLFLLGFYLVLACSQAATRLLWGDELITLAIARTGSPRAIWHALSLGADPNPPLSHVAVLFATSLFGSGALAVRLPSIAAMLLAIACIWLLLRRWVSPGYAVLGGLTFMATRGFDYSYEARSYAPLAGFSLAALLCWLRAVDANAADPECRVHPAPGRQRLARMGWLTGMAMSLALAVSSNYYGVLAWFPIAAGEAALLFRARKPSPATRVFLALGALPLLAYLPLIRLNIAEFTPHAWNRPHLSMVIESYVVLVEGVFWPVLLGALWLLRTGSASAWGSERRAGKTRGLQRHEGVALCVLLAYPFLGLAIALAKAGMISPRCVLPVCCGFGVAAGLIAARVVPGDRAATMALAAVVWVVARQSACAVLLHRQGASLLALAAQIRSAGPGPVYISDSSLVLPLAHYGGQELRQRFVFPIDFAAIDAREPDDSGEQNIWAGRAGVFPFRIVPYASALARTPPALVIARPTGWLPEELRRDGLTLKDVTTPTQQESLENLGGVFTPMAHRETRLLAPRP